MIVYLEGDPVKGLVPRHTTRVNPGGHLGVSNVLAALTETVDGKIVGKTFTVEFINGRASTEFDAVGEYMIAQNLARRTPWVPPAGSPADMSDPGWRWKEQRA